MPPDSENTDTSHPEPNWRWIIVCGGIGAALIGLAFFMEANHAWQGVSESAFVNAGTALLLAAILFLIEPRFVRRVGRAATQAASAAVDSRVDERTRELTARLDEIDQVMADEIRSVHAVQDEAVRAMDVPTFESVAGALAAANKIGALRHGHVTVPASETLEEMGLTFSWGLDQGDGRFTGTGLALSIKAEIYADFGISGGRPVIEVTWESGATSDEDESAASVGLRLVEMLRNRGRWNGDGTLKWQATLEHLQYAVQWAIDSRRRSGDGPLLTGALSELVTREWAVTDAGLECPAHDYILSGDEFPEHGGFRSSAPDFQPPRPVWIEEDLWQLLLGRARRKLPIRRGPVSMQSTWFPWQKSPREMRESDSHQL
jgi:hypothetical protein